MPEQIPAVVMEESIQNSMMHELRQTLIPQMIGGPERVFYGTAIRDTPFPFLVFNVDLNNDYSEMYMGEVLFSIWDYSPNSSRVLKIRQIIKNVFHKAHMEVPGVAACRFWDTGSRQAPVENNRSNRRSEDEHFWLREVTLDFRAWDQASVDYQEAHWTEFDSEFFEPNLDRFYSKQAVGRPVPGHELQRFKMPERVLRVLGYRIGTGALMQDFTLMRPDIVELSVPLLAPQQVTVTYIPM